MMSCMMFSITPATANAMQSETVTPMWDNQSQITASISFANGMGITEIAIWGDYEITNITAKVKLLFKSAAGTWLELPTNWNYNVNQSWLSISETFNAVAGREYKIEISGTVTMNGYAESISKTATAVCPVS